MKLLCKNCGSTDFAYFEQSQHNWYVSVTEGRDGKEYLVAEPSDCEETRYFVRNMSATKRVQEALMASKTLESRRTFDCSNCGQDDCVEVL